MELRLAEKINTATTSFTKEIINVETRLTKNANGMEKQLTTEINNAETRLTENANDMEELQEERTELTCVSKTKVNMKGKSSGIDRHYSYLKKLLNPSLGKRETAPMTAPMTTMTVPAVKIFP